MKGPRPASVPGKGSPHRARRGRGLEPWLRGVGRRQHEPGAGGRRVHERELPRDGERVGADALFGPNMQVYDHDHGFDKDGVRSELHCASVSIGQRCWPCANAVVTRGCSIADRSPMSASPVVTRGLAEAGALYADAPTRPIKRYDR